MIYSYKIKFDPVHNRKPVKMNKFNTVDQAVASSKIIISQMLSKNVRAIKTTIYKNGKFIRVL